VKVTVSIGVASVPHSRIRSAKDLVVLADKALYRAKRGGRNRVESEQRQEIDRVTSGEDTLPKRGFTPAR